MTRISDLSPTPSDVSRKGDETEEQQEMERVQKEAAQERATEGGYQ
jgi:hypothetical protein